MAFGILEPISDPMPPGTVLLENIQTDGRETDALRVPQPSKSSKDPLNMSRARKELYFGVLMFGACITGSMGPVLVPGFSIVAASFETSLTNVTLLNGFLVLFLGVSSYLCGVLADMVGRRLVFLFTTIVLLASCVWAAASVSYSSLLAARAFQGLGMGGFFSLAGTTSVNDVFFVHERGRRVGLWNFAVIVSVNIAPIISGYLIEALGWRWCFWMLAIFNGTLLVTVVALLPETLFERNLNGELSVIVGETTQASDGEKQLFTRTIKTPPSEGIHEFDQGNAEASGWKRLLGISSVRFQPWSTLLPRFIRPFALLQCPAVVWGCVMWTVIFTWSIITGAVADQIFAAPPYNLSASAVGLITGIPPLIGSAFGTLSGGYLCDLIAKRMSTRNEGIFEPEFRLFVMLPCLVTLAIGGYGLGIAISNESTIITNAVFLGFINFGIGIGCTGIVSYTNDVCGDRAGEAFGLAMLVKSAFAFGLSFTLNDYYAEHGPKVFWATWASLSIGVCLTTIPLYIFGKRLRSVIVKMG